MTDLLYKNRCNFWNVMIAKKIFYSWISAGCNVNFMQIHTSKFSSRFPISSSSLLIFSHVNILQDSFLSTFLLFIMTHSKLNNECIMTCDFTIHPYTYIHDILKRVISTLFKFFFHFMHFSSSFEFRSFHLQRVIKNIISYMCIEKIF